MQSAVYIIMHSINSIHNVHNYIHDIIAYYYSQVTPPP